MNATETKGIRMFQVPEFKLATVRQVKDGQGVAGVSRKGACPLKKLRAHPS